MTGFQWERRCALIKVSLIHVVSNLYMSCVEVVSSPDPTGKKGLVTFKGFLGFQNGGTEECECANYM